MKDKQVKFAVVGCGNGGQAMAADIALKGACVNLGTLPQFEERLDPIRKQGGIRISGPSRDEFAAMNLITSDVAELVRDANIICVVAPAYRQELIVRTLAPYFEDGQYIVFVSHFGAMNFRVWMRELGVKTDITPVESITLPYIARIINPGHVRVYAIKNRVPVAALPSTRTNDFLEQISGIFPQMTASESVLFTSLNNGGPVLQSALLLLNAGRIETTAGKGWSLLAEGFTPSVATVTLRVESERTAIVRTLGMKLISIVDSLNKFTLADAITGEAFSEAMRGNPIYSNPEMSNPESLKDRFISESVPYGLVPWSSIADMYSVPVPNIKALICLASTANDVDYLQEGVTAEKLGINKMSLIDLLRSVQ